MVWAISHFHHYLYGNVVTIYTDHTAVKAVLEMPNPTGKHARWWSRVYRRGVKQVRIVYRASKENKNSDALSRSPLLPAPEVGIAEEEVQVSSIDSVSPSDPVADVETDSQMTTIVDQANPTEVEVQPISTDCAGDCDLVVDVKTLFQVSSTDNAVSLEPFASEQRKDPEVKELMKFVESGALPEDDTKACRLVLQESLFTIVDRIVYFLDPKHGNRKRAVVPKHLRMQIL